MAPPWPAATLPLNVLFSMIVVANAVGRRVEGGASWVPRLNRPAALGATLKLIVLRVIRTPSAPVVA